MVVQRRHTDRLHSNIFFTEDNLNLSFLGFGIGFYLLCSFVCNVSPLVCEER